MAFAQESVTVQSSSNMVSPTLTPQSTEGTTKATALGDTLFFFSNPTEQSKTGASVHNNFIVDRVNPRDSGRFYGYNAWERRAYAQLYPYSSINRDATKDTTYNIIGVVFKFGGTVSNSSTRNITLSVWSRGTAKEAITGATKWAIYGYPGTTLATQSVSIKNLFATSPADRRSAYFTTPAVGVNNDVYVGFSTDNYTFSSMNGDTIGLSSTNNAPRYAVSLEQSTNDTLFHMYNVFQDKAGKWSNYLGLNSTMNISNAGDLMIYPIIRLNCANCFPSSIGSIGNDGFAVTGLYPNPAVNSTNVQFNLTKNADVNIAIMDINGRTVKTINKTNLNAGANTVNIGTSELAAGNYVVALETSTGGAIAIQFTVAK